MSDFEPTQVDPLEMIPMYDAQRLKPTALRLLELLSFIGARLPEEIIKSIALELLSVDSAFDEADYIEGRDALAEEPLIVLEGARKRLVILDTLQNQVFATLNDAKRKRFFEGITWKIWSEWPAGLPSPSKQPVLPEPKARGQRLLTSRWAVCDDMQPTISRLEEISPILTNVSSDNLMLFSKLVTEGAWYQIERGDRSKTLLSFLRATDIALKSDHPDKNATRCDIRHCLGVLAMESNDMDASRLHKEQSFEIAREICEELGVEDERLSLAYAERAIARIQDQQYDDGIADIQASIRIAKQLNRNYVPQTREANMGWALMGQGKLDECDQLLTESLAAREGALGRDDTESARTGLILAAIAALRAAQGDADESHTFYQRAWNQLRSTVGVRDSCTGRVAHKLAEHLLRVRRADEALVVINQALDAWAIDPLANQNEESRSMFLKSQALAALGRAEAARHVRKRSVDLYNSIAKQSRDMNSVTMADFDDLMPFWSR
ncbi:hypothetical protein NLG97_g1500 [Lecanicillium saksenae]|uniref:Uncharacterized protein n=1 Tax=Lecanicillium saksenae TaxID=468837 RepID=A0ACC1R3J9_9HYPO|nr:hypothetical protein NLG97_g1500 [Lecanicillium saksenae]